MVESKPGVRSRKVSNEVKQPVDSRARLFQAKLRNLKLKEKRAAEEKAVPPEPPAPLLPEVVRDVAMVPCPAPSLPLPEVGEEDRLLGRLVGAVLEQQHQSMDYLNLGHC